MQPPQSAGACCPPGRPPYRRPRFRPPGGTTTVPPRPASRARPPLPSTPFAARKPWAFHHAEMMNTPLTPFTKDLVQRLRELPRSERRAQLLALMPLLDSLFHQGVSHSTLANSLTNAGLPLKPESLRQALWRWRKRATAPNTGLSPTVGPTATPPAPGPQASQGPAPHQPTSPAAGGITSKADLVRWRKSQDPIDLTQLAELGRKK